MCFGLSKDKKLNRDKKIKHEKILHQDFCWRKQDAAEGTLTTVSP
jgi:hypothetical protein